MIVKVEEYIGNYTRYCSNEIVGILGQRSYHEWLTPENALAAVELAREEMKEQMMKDAIEGEVKTLYRHIVYVESVGFDSGSIDENKQGVFAGDKVKVIIVKE